jgi:hypothetical protein
MRQDLQRNRDRQSESSWRDAEELLQSARPSYRDEEDTSDTNMHPPRLRNTRLPRPDRQSSLRFEMSAQQSRSVSPRRRRLLSPPSSSGSGRNIPDHHVEDGILWLDRDPENLTPGFAPARQPDEVDRRGLETPPPETWESSLPPLSRSSRRPERPSHRPADGLGDRRRSPTPDPSAEEETWAHLLHTMDDNRSSATTSFASTRGSNVRSQDSQTTLATSFGEIGNDDSCDLDLPTGITEEIARDIREEHRSRERRQRRNHSEPDGPIMTGAQGLRQHEARMRQRTTASRPTAGPRASAQIQMIQQIMERFGEGELPDDWWRIMGWENDREPSTVTPSSTDGRSQDEIMQEMLLEQRARRQTQRQQASQEAAPASETRAEAAVPDVP